MRDAQVLEHRTHSFNRAKRRTECGTNGGLELQYKLLRDRAPQRLVMFEYRTQASSEDQIERLIHVEIDTVCCQRAREAAATQHFAIDQHAVAVENDEIGPDHRKFFSRSNQSIYPAIGQ